MAKRRSNTTRNDIIRTTVRLIVENGYSDTSPKMICDALDISTGNLTYYFPTKEHLLAVIVVLMCASRPDYAQEGDTAVRAVCMELAAIMSLCESNEAARDYFISAYSTPMSLDVIRRMGIKRAKTVFADTCGDWTEKHYAEAQTLVSGIEYATIMTTPCSATLDVRVAGAIESELNIYCVPKEERGRLIKEVLSTDYKSVGHNTLAQFGNLVQGMSDEYLDGVMARCAGVWK